MRAAFAVEMGIRKAARLVETGNATVARIAAEMQADVSVDMGILNSARSAYLTGTAKSGRKHTPTATELRVLDKSRRRCALCFHIHGHLTEKHGQIAHLDANPANTAEDKLAWLCLGHHSLYDSTASQHKNYTLAGGDGGPRPPIHC